MGHVLTVTTREVVSFFIFDKIKFRGFPTTHENLRLRSRAGADAKDFSYP
jgi:hypothetical protein